MPESLPKCVAYLMAHQNPDTGKMFTQAEADKWEPTINAYQNAGEIHIHEERGEVATAIHESMHLYASSKWKGKMGSMRMRARRLRDGAQ